MIVVLINPPSPYLANDAAYPPSGLMYVAAVLENIGHKPIISDLTGGIDWEKEVSKLDADLFGITCVTPNFKIVQRIAELLSPNIPIVIGGPHPTFLPEDTLSNIRCNGIVKGEAEVVMKELLEDLEKEAENLQPLYIPIQTDIVISSGSTLVDLAISGGGRRGGSGRTLRGACRTDHSTPG